MAAAVELDAVAVQDAEDARAASVAADLPDVVDRVPGVVHADNRLLPLQLHPGFLCLGMDVFPALEHAGFRATDGRGLRRKTADDIENHYGRCPRKQFSLGVNLIMDADEADSAILAKAEEDPEFPYPAKGIAEFADDNLIVLLEMGKHAPPLRTEPFLDSFFFYDIRAAERFHPCKVLLTGDQVPRKEQITDFCHILCDAVPQIYEEIFTTTMVL